jgi:hypothetical protein
MTGFLYLFVTLLVLFLLFSLSALFSASETSIIGLSKIRLRHLLSKEPRKAQHIQDLVVKLDKFIVAILLGNNFVNISISAILTAATVKVLGDQYGVLVSTLSATFFVLIFCEIVPKTLAIKHTEKIAMLSAPLMGAYIRLFNPVIIFSQRQRNGPQTYACPAGQAFPPDNRRGTAPDDRGGQGRGGAYRRREKDAAPHFRIRGYPPGRSDGAEREDCRGQLGRRAGGTPGNFRRTGTPAASGVSWRQE